MKARFNHFPLSSNFEHHVTINHVLERGLATHKKRKKWDSQLVMKLL